MGADIVVGVRDEVIERAIKSLTYKIVDIERTLIDHAVVDNVIYGVVEEKHNGYKKRDGVVVRLEQHHHHWQDEHIQQWSVKFMHENEGPFRYDCPPRLLKMMTQTVHPWAMNWRAKCWDTARRILNDVEVHQLEREKTLDKS